MKRLLFVALGVLALTPLVSAPVALLAGVGFALVLGNPFPSETKGLTTPLLQISVVGLGAAMDLGVVARVGAAGLGYTVAGITFTMALGALLARLLGTDRDTSLLVSVGTAICGGSAIAAAAPAIRARGDQTSVALAVVFLLNAAALFAFPAIGRALELSDESFGLWSALAIHDTSSVVGAALQFGPEAVDIATTVKLARALWIVPVVFVLARWRARRSQGTPAPGPRPWFIAGFLGAAALATWAPGGQRLGESVAGGARQLLVLTLFLVGSSISRQALRSVGPRPVVQGLALWVVVAAVTLGAVAKGWIHVDANPPSPPAALVRRGPPAPEEHDHVSGSPVSEVQEGRLAGVRSPCRAGLCQRPRVGPLPVP